MFEAMPSGGALRDMRDGVQGTAWRDEMTMLPRLFDDDVFSIIIRDDRYLLYLYVLQASVIVR